MKNYQNNFGLIRFIAAFQVLIVHGSNSIGLDFFGLDALKLFPGVPIFFFISGYLIIQSYDRLSDHTLWVFFAHRAFRIFPALIVCTLLSIIALYFSGYLQRENIGLTSLIIWFLSQVTIFQFYNPEYFRGIGTGVINGALWTITVELQFYIIVPILSFLIVKKSKLIILLVITISIGFNLFIRLNPSWDDIIAKLIAVSFIPWVFMFIFGVFVARSNSVQSSIMRIPFLVLLSLFIISMFLVLDVERNAENGINPISFVLLSLLIFKFAHIKIHPIFKFFNKTDMSYGLYLFHMPIINFLLYFGLTEWKSYFAILFTTAFFISFCSWRFIEKPALNFVKNKVG